MNYVWLLGTAISMFALATPSYISLPKKLIYNASASAPTGLYWVDDEPLKRGDYVLVGVPERVQKLIVERNYLSPGVPLLKRVAGIEGDEICRCGRSIMINRVTVAMAQSTDRLGRRLPKWRGCLVLTESSVFLLQDHPLSFDGRYFGPVDRKLIIGRATKLRFRW